MTGPAPHPARPPVPAPATGGTAGVARIAGAFLAASLLASACAGIPDPPPAPGYPEPSIARRDSGDRAAVPRLTPRAYPVPPRPWVVPEVRFTPEGPRSGEALGIRLEVPCGARAPREVMASFGDQTVRFGTIGDEWFGVVALPPDASGSETLTLRLRASDDSVSVLQREIEVRDRTYPRASLSVAPRFSDPPAALRERIERERRLVDRTLAGVTPGWLLTEDVRLPRETRVTSPFGQRRVFNGELQSRHWGVDLRGREGEPVRAAARGRVALVHDLYFAGRAVFLDHGHGVFTGYFHLSRAGVAHGDTVQAGQVIGRVGASGRVTGAHLHWSLWVNGVHLDARSLLSLDIPSERAAAGRRAACRG